MGKLKTKGIASVSELEDFLAKIRAAEAEQAKEAPKPPPPKLYLKPIPLAIWRWRLGLA